MITINKTSCFLGNISFCNPDIIEKSIENELDYMGFNQCVIIILDTFHNPVFHYHRRFSHHQLDTYIQYMNHDVYLKKYLENHFLGKLTYLQELIPENNINDEIFRDILLPTLQIKHAMAGLHPLVNNHLFFLSAYTEKKTTVEQQMQLHEFWKFMLHWSNGWIAQQMMREQWQYLSYHGKRTNLHHELTPSEKEVLRLLSQGLDGSEIANYRKVSKETVRSQIKQLLKKTGSKHQNQLISRYYLGQLNTS